MTPHWKPYIIRRGGEDFLPSSLWLIEGYTAPKIGNNYSKNELGSFSISAFMYLWAIYICPWSVRIFNCITFADRSWKYINRSPTHEGSNCTGPYSSISGNICFEFSVQCICSLPRSIKTGTYLVADRHKATPPPPLPHLNMPDPPPILSYYTFENWFFLLCYVAASLTLGRI